eukprot:gene6676-9159_t
MSEKTPAVDQDGKMINPHNPDFITKVPWYLGSSGPTLKHHGIQKVDHFLSISESDSLLEKKRSAQKALKSQAPNTYRKGSCKNCGAASHTEKDCVERPRSSKKSAWKSNLDIAPDEATLHLESHGKVSYDAKRDQWKGYDPTDYKETIERHNRLEAERLKVKKELLEQQKKNKMEMKAKAAKDRKEKKKSIKSEVNNEDNKSNDDISASDSDSDYGSDEDDDDEEMEKGDFLEKDEAARDFQGTMVPQGGVGGNGMRVTVRNLRLREDTPKYLRNLALDSAFYDPKSRSMRLNPLPNENPEDLAFAGDNFVRHSGDALKLAANQVLCWEMQSRGESVDVISNPSQAELLHKQFVEKKKDLVSTKKRDILLKYLDSDELDDKNNTTKTLDPRLKLGQTEVYTEYSKDGRVVKGAIVTTKVVKTKYEEDVLTNNHLSVWGSYFNLSQKAWGYQCCHSLLKNSYCTGEVGKQANDAANNVIQTIDSFQARKMLEKKPMTDRSVVNNVTNRNDVFGESSIAPSAKLDEEKLAIARKKAEENNNDDSDIVDDRKRQYNSIKSLDVTVEDMEVYRLKKTKTEDPMAALLDSDVLLEYEAK